MVDKYAVAQQDNNQFLDFGRCHNEIAIAELDPFKEVPMVSLTVQQIAQQNDRFRQGDPNIPGQRFVTAGINELLKRLKVPPEELAQAVAEFSEFTEDNDPHGEHDFGAFEFHQHKLFWKIDAYDNDYSMGSDDPSDLSKTCRVLTIMLAKEY